MRQYSGGLSNVGQNMMNVGRNSGYMNNQLRAIGTTLRYTFAGTMVFGLARMGTELSNIQTQLALMGSVGQVIDQAGQSVELTDQKLSTMLDNIQRRAPDALTNVNDLAAGVVNFLSSVQDYPENQVVDTVTRIAQVAQIAQVGTADMTKAVTGMNQAFGRDQNIRNYEQLLRGVMHVIQEAPGGISAGGEIIQQLAPLSAVARLSRISPGQMLGGYLTVLRGGGTPSTAGRGWQYLMQSIAQPTKQGLGAQAAAGITPQLVQERGGMWALEKMMSHARGLGISGLDKLQGLTDEQLDLIEQGGGAESLGISGAGMTYLRESIGRIHGIRALALLMAMKDKSGNPKYGADQRETAGFMEINATNEKEFADQIEKFLNRQPLKRMTMGLVSLRQQIEQDVEPLINPVARGTSWVATKALDHQKAATGVEIGVAAILAGLGIRRFAKGGGIPGAKGAGLLAGAMALGEEGLGASPMNPMFVVVVGNMFGQGGGFNWTRKGGLPPVDPGTAAKGSWWKRAAAGAGGILAKGGKFGARHPYGVGGPFAAALVALEALVNPDEAGGAGDIYANPQVARQRLRHAGNLSRAQWLNPNVMQLYRAQKTENFRGKAQMTVDVLVKQPDGKSQRKTYHVPMEYLERWEDTSQSRQSREDGIIVTEFQENCG